LEALTHVLRNRLKNRPGPITALSDAQLHTRRDQLVQVFEDDWARVGGELQKCKTENDLIRVFSPFENGYAHEFFSPVCRTSNEPATGALTREIRRELRTLIAPSYAVEASKRKTSSELQEVNWALGKGAHANRRSIERVRKRRRKQAAMVEQQFRALSTKEHDLKSRLQSLESSFARQEILKFVKSRRYELNPVNLANALANLPFSGWRQSMKRSKRSQTKIGNGMFYQIFKAIRFLTVSADRPSENILVRDFRAGILSLPSRHRLAKVELAKNWLFLERAVRQGYKTADHPRRLHFEIANLYFQKVRSGNADDKLVAENHAIDLQKRSRRRRSVI